MKCFCSLWFILSLLLNNKIADGQKYYNTEVPNPLVNQNIFINQNPDTAVPPAFEDIRSELPQPVWPQRQDVIRCYWRTWQLAFSNLHKATSKNGFIQPYIDPAFNNHIFMWDTNFMLLFGIYGRNAFNFQGSLDNFYNKQHKDGYISREISEDNGNEIFGKYDPSSTGPNIMPWAEWQYYQTLNDSARLKAVFAPLLAYYEWYRTNRSWPDGSYFSTGWGCGMDNQPRLPSGFNPEFSPAFMSWIDITAQQIFAGKLLVKMAKVLHKENEVKSIEEEIEKLTTYIQKNMWDAESSFFYDRFRDGSLSHVKSIAGYWTMLAEILPKDGEERFIDHLNNPKEFNRLHRVPTLSADDSAFNPNGGYWRGGVWAPTTYMVLSGLNKYDKDSLAHTIAFNDVDNVVNVFNQNGKLWENYAPDKVQGNDTKDLVGWTGLVPITELFEYVFGIRADAQQNMIVWDVRLLDEFGIKKYPFKKDGIVDFWCAKRKAADKPRIKVHSNVPFTLKLLWEGGSEIINIKANGG